MYNILSYFLYFSFTIPVIVFVGWKCFKIGKVYLLDVLKDDEICNSVNKLLLLGYYLFNVGYIAISISNWGKTDTYYQLVEVVSTKIALILIIISLLHYVNIAMLYFLRNQIISTFK
ncbi:hypothetical protein [Chryseobacterium sp. MP_3.2]|uniref:hypothetical protein n=1 Tax=Chryseobacterium sp. MP_3.2 TaxID=3071712 RepID=UPI002DFD2116|nr:hypothetical protein [Chryseobacterium sp. MP_3.2]